MLDKDFKDLLNHVTDLVISDHETDGRPALVPGGRPILVAGLEQVLVNWDDLGEYLRQIASRQKWAFRHHRPLADAELEAVLAGGLDAMDDPTLARLALDPVALTDLSEEIDERMPAAWWDAMARDGEALMREHGRTIPVNLIDEFEPELVEALGIGGEVKVGLAAPQRSWRFERRPEGCSWHAGSPADVSGEMAIVEAEWRAPGPIRVAVFGFLRLGPGFTVEARWTDLHGDVRAESRIVDTIALIDLDCSQPTGPRRGDRLEVRHLRTSTPDGWDVRLAFEFD